MCGILGVRKSLCPDRAAAERALASLRWRGPDGTQLIEVGDWWLGVARLAITDPAAAQPIVCPRTGRAVALNGAITSAAADWERVGARARTRNDAELLLLRYEDGGALALLDVTGPYAFAIVDPNTGELWLGRDPELEKPLWIVADAGHVVAFASTPTALRELRIDHVVDARGSSTFLRYGFWYRHGGAFPPGARHVLPAGPGLSRVDERGLGGTAPVPAVSTRRGGPIADALRAAVARCATAEVAVGLALSGGIDSACIAACLAEQGRHLPCYQARAAGEPTGERARARAVAAHLDLALVEVDFDETVLRSLPELTRAVGLPLGDPSMLAVHALSTRAAADGVRVLLSGEGADELLLGYDRHRAAARMPRRGLGGLPAPQLRNSRTARLLRALGALEPYDALLEVTPTGFRRVATTLPDVGLCGLLAGDSHLDLRWPLLAKARTVDRLAYLPDDLLVKLDTATMAAGIEGRCPFLDPEVTRSREATDPDARRILGKRALRAGFEDALPPGHFDQRKRGFAVPIDRWWREDSFLPDLLLEKRTLERPHLRANGVRRMLDHHRHRGARLGHALYLLVAYELYLRAVEDA